MNLLAAYQAFRDSLELQKQRIPRDGWDWYPYQSMENVPRISVLLDAARFSFKELLEAGPVLDIGCGDGDLAFFVESFGGSVDALDYAPTNYNGMRGVRSLAQTLQSSVSIQDRDIDRSFEAPRKRYGLCLAFGLLYHLKNPYAFLETIHGHADYCFVSTRIARCFPGTRGTLDHTAAAYLLDPEECNNDDTNYWIFSDAGLRRILRRTGWLVRGWMLSSTMNNADPVRSDRDLRAFCFLQADRLRPWRAVDLGSGWHSLEDNSFRWTAGTFTLTPRVPGELRMKVYISDQFKTPVTLTGVSAGQRIAPEHFQAPGLYDYVRSIQKAEEIRFETSACLPGDAVDKRERGLVVSSIDIW